MAISPIPNTVQKRAAYAGTETVRGTAVTPTYKLYGDLQVNKRTTLIERPSYAGTYDTDYTPTFGLPEIDGTYAQVLTFEDAAILPRYWIAGDPANDGGDAGSPEAFAWEHSPTAATDDLDSMTAVYGFDGVIFRSTGIIVNEGTIRGNADDGADAWMFDARLFVREKELQVGLAEVALTAVTAGPPMVLTPAGGGMTIDALIGQYVEVMSGPGASQVALITDNDATTITIDRVFSPAPTTSSTVEVSGEFPSIADRDRTVVPFAGTQLFVGDEGDTIGTDHQVVGRFVGFSATLANNINPKRMADDTTGYSAKIDRGARRVTAQITMEFDDWRELRRWEENATRLVRIRQPLGPIVHDAVRQTVHIDLPGLYWEQMSEDVRNSNIRATYQGRGFVDSVLGYSFALAATNELETLP